MGRNFTQRSRNEQRQVQLRRTRLFRALLAVAAGLLTFGGCASDTSSMLDPQGPRADNVALISWVMFALAIATFLVVTALYLIAVWRGRHQQDELDEVPPVDEEGDRRGIRFVIIGGIVIPAVILAAVMGMNIWTMSALSAPESDEQLSIEVIGYQFWWEVRYPDSDVFTANEIHIPTDEPVELTVDSADVIHSFWVPQLAGKIDVLPGQENTTWIEASEPGVYRGQCAEFCGIQHAKMEIEVVAEPPEQFDQWLEQQRQPAAEPETELQRAGRQAFMRPSCMGCHTIEGTPAQGRKGPDLTHVGSRRTIAAGALPRNHGTLAGWISDPQGIKPGNQMPDLQMDLDTAYAIAAYLNSLK